MTDGFRDAERKSAKPLIGLFSESGCGKTMSALLVARGYVGPSGSIGMIETESGRGEAYADKREYPEIAGYRVLPMRDDFSPKAYSTALKKAEDAKLDALIIDSGSHEWEGPGGVLDMADKNNQPGVLKWQRPKIEHKREFMLKLMQTPIPLVILCLRAKYPMEKKGSDWVRSTKLEPIQSDDILFEMFVHGWIDQAHAFHLTKTTSRALASVFEDGKTLTLDTGRKLRAWADGADLGIGQSVGGAVQNGIDMAALEREGREAAEGGPDVLQAWVDRTRRNDWPKMTREQQQRLSALRTGDLAEIARQATQPI